MDFKYPYTDYHELNLDWFLSEFKNLVETWARTQQDWISMQQYIRNYFDNLNVQTEIDNKINAMIQDGTFGAIVEPFVTAALPAMVAGQLPDVVAAQISAVVAAQIGAVVAGQLPAIAAQAASDEVGTWLAAHIDPDTGYVIDDTLTVSNAAADAKVVGDIISAAEDGLSTLYGKSEFIRGFLSNTGEILTNYTYRVCTDGYATFARNMRLKAKTGFRFTYSIEINDEFVTTTWFSGDDSLMIAKNFPCIIQIARITEDHSENADIMEFCNAIECTDILYDVKTAVDILSDSVGINSDSTWVQGGIDGSGDDSATTYRIRSDYIKMADHITIVPMSGFSAVIYQYDKDKNPISGTGTSWDGEPFSITKHINGVYFRIALSWSNGASKVMSISYGDLVQIINYYDNIGETLSEVCELVYQKGEHTYSSSEKMPASVFEFNAAPVTSMSYNPADYGVSQDIDIFDNVLFVAFGNDYIRLYDMSDWSVINTFNVSTEHGGGMQFSSEYYDVADDYPLLYVGATDGHIKVIRFSGEPLSASVVRKLYLDPSEYGYYAAPSIDKDHNILYTYGYKLNSYSTASGNAMILSKFNLNDLTDNGDGTYTPAFIEKHEVIYEGVTQGRKYYGNRLYVSFANTVSPVNPCIKIIDANTANVIGEVPLTDINSGETEGLCLHIKSDGSIRWFLTYYYAIYELLFI